MRLTVSQAAPAILSPVFGGVAELVPPAITVSSRGRKEAT
jgi:hypothetical protein